MARTLTWLVKCKGKHICLAKPALLDFDKPAQIALVLQSRMGWVSALILAGLQTLGALRMQTIRQKKKIRSPINMLFSFLLWWNELSLCKKDLHIPPPSGNSVHQHLWEQGNSKSGSADFIKKDHLGDLFLHIIKLTFILNVIVIPKKRIRLQWLMWSTSLCKRSRVQ